MLKGCLGKCCIWALSIRSYFFFAVRQRKSNKKKGEFWANRSACPRDSRTAVVLSQGSTERYGAVPASMAWTTIELPISSSVSHWDGFAYPSTAQARRHHVLRAIATIGMIIRLMKFRGTRYYRKSRYIYYILL